MLGMVTKPTSNQTFNITSSMLKDSLIMITNKTQITNYLDTLMNGPSTEEPLKVTDVIIKT